MDNQKHDTFSRVLIIDDDRLLTEMLSDTIKKMGHDVSYVHTIKRGLSEASKNNYDVIFLDVGLPDGSGLDVLDEFKNVASAPEIIIFTANGDPLGAEMAIEGGAWDYIEKPTSLNHMMLPLKRALKYREAKKMRRPQLVLKRDKIIGNGAPIKACLDRVVEASYSNGSVLITGETGTGKELFALAIHENSGRKDKPFVTVDCASLTESLVESILFGHEKGAYTGAHSRREGLVKQANKGTLFLDEIGELPLTIQKSFLRVLNERRFRPLGAKEEEESDFRLIAATNRDLETMSKEGVFRDDLLYRIRAFTINLPPLRERLDDLEELVKYHVDRICKRDNLETKELSNDFLDKLALYKWPGNVRELVAALDRAVGTALREPVVYTRHLPNNIRVKISQASLRAAAYRDTGKGRTPTLQEIREAAMERAERDYLQELMTREKRELKRVGDISGLSKSRLYELISKYKIERKI